MKERKEMVANKYYLPELVPLNFLTETWKLQLVLSEIEDAFYLSARATNGDKLRKIREIDQRLGPFALIDDNLVLTQFDQTEKWIELFHRRKEIEIPKNEAKDFLSKVFSNESAPEVILPSSLELSNVTGLKPKVHLVFEPTRGSTLLFGKIKFIYDGVSVDPLEKRPALVDVDGGRRIFRDAAEEDRALQAFVDFSPLRVNTKTSGGRVSSGYFTEKQLKTIVQKVIPLGWEVLAFQKQVRRPKDYQLTLKSNVDWFDVNLKIDFGGAEVDFPELLQSLRRGEKYISLGDGSLGVLPDEWLQQLKTISEIAIHSKKSVKLNRVQALFLSAHLQSLNKLAADADFQGLAKIVQELKALQPSKAPAAFLGELRPYQEVGLSWLGLLSAHQIGGVLADDMGLGKTIQVLALLAGLRRNKSAGPHLIVVPKSLVFNWMDEIKKFTPHLKVVDYSGPKRTSLLKELSSADIVLTTYPTLRVDIEHLKSVQFDYFILDEAHSIKNAASQSALVCRMVTAQRKIALTGTPIENSLSDLFSILAVVNPGLLGESQSQKWAKERDPELLSSLGKALSPFLLRRSKDEVLKDLPAKTEQVLYCELSPEERKNYDELKKFYWAQITGKISEKGLQKSKIEVLEALLRLRQAACHQGLLKSNMKDSPSSKFEIVLDQIKNLVSEGHKALVFSQFTSLLELFKKELNKHNIPFEYLDGQTKNRQERVENFQKNSEVPVFLLSLKAGGVGLNLTAADYVFILDPWWNPAAEAQAIDRTHRIGQSRSVFAYKIISKDTVEEKILEIQKHKRSLAKAVVSDEKSILKSLKIEDLQALFS
jgi:superfamily II DNA or RNA helicase